MQSIDTWQVLNNLDKRNEITPDEKNIDNDARDIEGQQDDRNDHNWTMKRSISCVHSTFDADWQKFAYCRRIRRLEGRIQQPDQLLIQLQDQFPSRLSHLRAEVI